MTNKINEEIILWLIANKDFRDWVLAPTENNHIYWEKWLEVNQEKREALLKARATVLTLKFEEQRLTKEEKDEMLSNIVAADKLHLRDIIDFQPKIKWWMKMAASFAFLLIGALFVIFSIKGIEKNANITQVTTGSAERKTIELPDGSMVSLNANSTVSYPMDFSGATRSVKLVGEAYFEVTENKNQPFVVTSGTTETTALGTAFNIQAWPDDGHIDISLVTGKVIVHFNGKRANSTLLEPGEKAIYDLQTDQFTKTNFNVQVEVGWKDNVLVFKKASLEDFVSKLERWYGVNFLIENPPHEAWSIDGEFKDASLEEVLDVLNYIYKADYKINENTVTLKF